MLHPILSLHYTKEEALSFVDSWVNRYYEFGGIQLLPFNQSKYVQSTNLSQGIYLEDWEVKVVNSITEEEIDITASFTVENVFNLENGTKQILWSLKNIPYDFGYDFVYLKVSQVLGQTFYSNVLRITEFEKEKTSEFAYKEKRREDYQIINLCSWYRQPFRIQELTTYYETSTQSTVQKSLKINKLEKHEVELASLDFLNSFIDILSQPYLYINSVRCNLFESPEFPTLEAQQNFGKLKFTVSPKPWDIFSKNKPALGDWKQGDWNSNDFKIYTQ